ncbi:probable methyltransferase PMT26 [Aristolochia californica]|uniref:probable methyltransferase PMT26 n=1 Tax=Aristolochia californica TaxID=171875 RepID=UPI0035D9ED6D
MAFGKNPRMDSRRSSSSYCSSVTIVVFVVLCLVGVWMMTSSAVVPVRNVDTSPAETNTEVKQEVNEPGQFEDRSGDVNGGAATGDPESDANLTQDGPFSEEKGGHELDERSSQQKVERKNDAEDMTKTEGENVNEGKADTGEVSNEGQMNDREKETEDKSEEKKKTESEEEGKESDNKLESEEKKISESEEDGKESENNKKPESEENESEDEKKSESEEKASEDEKKAESEESSIEKGDDVKEKSQIEEVTQTQDSEGEKNSGEGNKEELTKDEGQKEVFPDAGQSEIQNETNTQNGAFSTQATESKNEKEIQEASKSKDMQASFGYSWKLCNVTAGSDYIPCLDNEAAIRKLRSTKHYEHRERHCPEEGPTCLVPQPEGYKRPISWPDSRNKIWYHNVPHTKLAVIKGHQNWVKVTGEYLTFPGGGTQFKHGALHYIDFIQEMLPDIAWGKRSRVVLDVGCGVASFGGYLFDRDVITMSFAPKDEHEAQVQFALERGIPAISAVMGTNRLPFPGQVFDIVHCARCRVPWHIEGGKLLLELNRMLRPGGYFLWSATPVYQKLPEDVGIWKAMSALTESMCWERVALKRDSVNKVGIAIYKKPSSNKCYEGRSVNNPPLCPATDDPNAAWNIPLQTCMHRVPESTGQRGSQWPELWPQRLDKTPYWLNDSQTGVYGKPAPEDFMSDYEHWKHVVSKSYLNGMGIDWSTVRNVMDMRSVYGGFAAALRDKKVWVMNVVSIDAPDTLPIIYERGLFGIYHDWCESFSTYPRTYDLLHADHLFSKLKKRCKLTAVMAEVDRMLRPEGKLIVRDKVDTINEVENMAKSLQWEIRLTYSKEQEGLLCVQKTFWRPQEIEMASTSSNLA